MQVLNIHSGVWRQHNQFIVVSLLFNTHYWMVTIGDAHAHTCTHTRARVETRTCASLHISMVCCAETEWTGLFPTYCTWVTSVSLWKLYVSLHAWSVCVGVWISHLQKLWFSRSGFAYAHDMINCNTLSFLLSFTTRTHAHTSTHCHTSTFSYARIQKRHCGVLKGKWWKGTVRRTASWRLFEKKRVLQLHLCCHCSR